MNILNLIYVNTDFKTMVDFEVEISMSYEMAYEQYGVARYIPELLKLSRPIIQAFGDAIRLPNELAMYMSDEELDYFLLLLHKSVDALIDGHIYIRLPSKHATSITSVISSDEIWRVNGIGLNGAVLARKNAKDGVSICIPTFKEIKEEFVVYEAS